MVDESFHTDKLVVIGPGMLGTSLALGLRKRGFAGQIAALGRSQATLDRAKQAGAYDVLSTDPAQVLPDATLAVIAVPLGGFRAAFTQITEHASPGLVITDVGSTKLSVIQDAQACLGNTSRLIGAHPMAGSEKAGPNAANPDLFHAKPCVLTPEPDADPQALALVRALWQTLGMSILTMTPQQHDENAAVVSHLPHLAAVMLVQVAQELGGLELASTGYRDTTRLASSNPPMRADILDANRQAVRTALAELKKRCEKLEELLAIGDRNEIHTLLDHACDAQRHWLKASAQTPR